MGKSLETRQNYKSFKMILDKGLSEKVINYAQTNEMKSFVLKEKFEWAKQQITTKSFQRNKYGKEASNHPMKIDIVRERRTIFSVLLLRFLRAEIF